MFEMYPNMCAPCIDYIYANLNGISNLLLKMFKWNAFPLMYGGEVVYIYKSYVMLQSFIRIRSNVQCVHELISCQMQRCVKEKSAPDPFNHLTYYIHAHHVNMFRLSLLSVFWHLFYVKNLHFHSKLYAAVAAVAAGIHYFSVPSAYKWHIFTPAPQSRRPIQFSASR